MSSRWHHVMTAVMFAAGVGCSPPEGEQELTAEISSPLASTQTLTGYKSNAGAPASWWHDTGINIDTWRYRASFTCLGGAIQPWAGHPGLGCGGDGSYWSQSLASYCPYGSLIGKVGMGSPFCIGNNTGWIYPGATGRLYIAFNDGLDFQDNSGYWNVDMAVNLDAPKIKMPFQGYMDKNGRAVPGSHYPLRDSNGITEWATDVFPSTGPGTSVVFRVSDGLTGQVVWKGNACGTNTAGGTTLIIDLMQGSTRIGRALYAHLGGTTPALWQTLSTGAVLGQTVPVPTSPIWGCYEVSNAQDTHVHFELGTRKDTVGTANSACWANYSGTVLRDSSAKLGQFGLTGFPSPQRCP